MTTTMPASMACLRTVIDGARVDGNHADGVDALGDEVPNDLGLQGGALFRPGPWKTFMPVSAAYFARRFPCARTRVGGVLGDDGDRVVAVPPLAPVLTASHPGVQAPRARAQADADECGCGECGLHRLLRVFNGRVGIGAAGGGGARCGRASSLASSAASGVRWCSMLCRAPRRWGARRRPPSHAICLSLLRLYGTELVQIGPG